MKCKGYTPLQSMDLRVNHLNPSRPVHSEYCIKVKNNLNFYFHTSFWCLKSLYEGLQVNHQRNPEEECANFFICKKQYFLQMT